MCLDIEWIFKLFAEVWDVLKSFCCYLPCILLWAFRSLYSCAYHIYGTIYTRKSSHKVGRKYDHVKWETCQIIHRRDVVFETKDISYVVYGGCFIFPMNFFLFFLFSCRTAWTDTISVYWLNSQRLKYILIKIDVFWNVYPWTSERMFDQCFSNVLCLTII